MVMGADAGPFEGESLGSMALTRSAEKRAKNASSAWLRDLPARTCFTKRRAAGMHFAHLRDSFTHCAMLTGSLGQGARSSETHVDQSFFSRDVSEPVSTPGRLTSVSADPPPGAWPAPAELRQVLS
jgi:hypothetical protein